MPARERTAVPRRLRRIGARPRQRGPWSIGRPAQSSPLGAPDCAKRLMAPKAAERGGWSQRRTLYPARRLRSQRPEETASGRLPAWTCDESPRWRSYGSRERRLGSVARSASVRRECSARAGVTRCLRVRERHPVAEGEEPDALGHARVEARSGLRYSRSEEPAIEPAIDRERHPGDVAGRVARQEHDRAGELLGCPVPAQRYGQRHPPEGVVH